MKHLLSVCFGLSSALAFGESRSKTEPRPDPYPITTSSGPPCNQGRDVKRGRDESDGTARLRSYLNAPAHVSSAFDREVKRKLDEDLESDNWVANEIADDPIAQAVAKRREGERVILDLEPVASTVDMRWDERWERRANRPTPLPGEPEHYSRDTDPLLALDLLEVWEQLTGQEINHGRRVYCPSPNHDDRWPDCAVYSNGFNCFSCAATGSIIDLGALVYEIEPRGKGFHDIRRRLLADLGMDDQRAA